MSAFSIPLSGLAASSDSLNVIANNLSNLNTDGYKDETLNFADVFNQMQGVSGNGDPIQIGSGVQVDGQTSNYTNGTVTATGIASNLALQGNGFFVVQNTGNGEMSFTRDGAFSVNSQGELCTSQGQLVMGYPAVNGVVSTSVALAPIDVNQAANIPAVQTSTFSMDTNLNASAAPGDSYSNRVRFPRHPADPYRDLHEHGARILELRHHSACIGYRWHRHTDHVELGDHDV